jgi:uncharacterized phiE125 gp8 family phage protein
MITWPSKNPAEVEDFLFDFTDALQEGETIATRAVTVTGATKDSDAIVGVDPGTANGVRVWISDGTLGTVATALAVVTTSGGRTYSETAILPIGEEPVSLVEAKAYLRVNAADEDAKIAAMIPRARKWIEDHTGLALMQRTFVERHLPRHGAIALYKGPLLSVDDVTYTDSTGDQTYVPRFWPPSSTIFPAANDRWPVLMDSNRFEVTYTAGFAPGEVDERLIGAMLALVEGEFSEGYAYPDRSIYAAEQCCGYLRQMAL